MCRAAKCLNQPSMRWRRGHSLLRTSFLLGGLLLPLFSEPTLRVQAQLNEVAAEKPVATPAPTQENGIAGQELVTPEQLEQLRKQIEPAAELDEENRKKLLDTLQKAADAVARAVKLEAQAPVDRAAIDVIGERVRELQAALAEPLPEPLPDISDDASLAELQAALAGLQPKLQDARQKLADQEAEPARRVERRAAIVSDQATHAARKAEIEQDLAATAPAEESAFATAARRALLQARLREIIAEGPAHQAELSRYDASKAVDLPTLKIQQERREVTRLEQEVAELTKRITAKRSQDARYIAEQLELFSNGEVVPTPYDLNGDRITLFAGPLQQPQDLAYASSTAELAEKNVSMTTLVTRATADLAATAKSLEKLRALKTRTQEKIARVGLDGAIGLELRQELRKLDDPSLLRRQGLARQEEMRELYFQQWEFEDQARALAERIDELKGLQTRTPFQQAELRLGIDRRNTLTTLERNTGDYFNRLGELDAKEQERIREIDDFSTFIQERVLWIRSNRWPGPEDLTEIAGSTRWLLSVRNWSLVTTTLWLDLAANAWDHITGIALIALLFAVQPRFRRNLNQIADVSSRATCREFRPTVRAAILTLILSLAWPAVPAFFSWRLLSDPGAPAFARAVGEGFRGLTAGFLTLNLLRTLCRPGGLGAAHFEWPANSLRLLRERIYGLMIFLLPLVFLDATLHGIESSQSRNSLDRLVFVVSLTLLANFLAAALHPQTGVFRDFLALNPARWIYRLRWPLYWLAVFLPLSLAALAIVGFYYTAYELSWRLYVTAWILIALLILRSFLIRWFVVSHRRLRIEQARQRRQALAEEAQADPNTSNIPRPSPQETALDLQEVSDQTQRFINSLLALLCLMVMWLVWIEVLPALGILNRWELWPTTVDVTVEYTDESGIRSFRTEPQIESITVADAIVALVLTLLTFTAARNIPGLLEMTILQRLPMEPASRYAFRMVARYLIVVVGLVFAFNSIGIRWSQVQWLAAALTVGLGFGLQEIFANFVSGLIILFERPIRIGDVVTIGDVSGSVSRIQIRATTLTDWDRKEYIVPNKEFVTGRLLNWTLSDTVNRVVILVGVAYGSDTNQARSLLLEVAGQHPDVMDDPGPIATFEGFGDSTLNLVLRCYLPNLDKRLATISELHEAIDSAFKQADIEISFPQRDLHIRSLPTLPPGAGLPQQES